MLMRVMVPCLFLLLVGCEEIDEYSTQAYSADLDPATGQIYYAFPSGYQTTSGDEFQAELDKLYWNDEWASADVDFGENISGDLGNGTGSYPLMPFRPIRVGKYILTGGRSEKGYVPGCIGRQTEHYNIRLNKQDGGQVFDWHFAWRFDNGWQCLDMYESVRPLNWCNNPCLPTGAKMREYFENIRSSISQAALDQGVPYATATALGTVGAYLVVAGIAVLPGPPLPP